MEKETIFRITAVRYDMVGFYLTLFCHGCSCSFERFQPTVAGLAFGCHQCPQCKIRHEVRPEDFEAACSQLLPHKEIEEMLAIDREATRIAESWYRLDEIRADLTYESINLGEPTERGLVGCICLGLALGPKQKDRPDE